MIKNSIEQLSAMSAQELDVTIAKLRGLRLELNGNFREAWVPDMSHCFDRFDIKAYDEAAVWSMLHKYYHDKLPHYSTSAFAAMSLMDEMCDTHIHEIYPTPTATGLRVVEYHSTNPSDDVEIYSVRASGKPSEALPHAIAVAYILYKQATEDLTATSKQEAV